MRCLSPPQAKQFPCALKIMVPISTVDGPSLSRSGRRSSHAPLQPALGHKPVEGGAGAVENGTKQPPPTAASHPSLRPFLPIGAALDSYPKGPRTYTPSPVTPVGSVRAKPAGSALRRWEGFWANAIPFRPRIPRTCVARVSHQPRVSSRACKGCTCFRGSLHPKTPTPDPCVRGKVRLAQCRDTNCNRCGT